jgi:anti-sigma regulatory factor (Ser/Thr protein kinase)
MPEFTAVDQGLDLTIDQAVRYIAEFCHDQGLENSSEVTLSLVAEELISNTFKYGEAAPGSAIGLALRLESGLLVLRYRDAGLLFNPHHNLSEDDREKRLEDRRIGGLGWPLIFDLCERVDYVRDGEQNITTLHLAPKQHGPK